MDIMTSLFDQDEVTRRVIIDHERKAEKKGKKEGKKEGMQEMAVKTCRDCGKSYEETRDYIQSNLKLSDKDADEAMKKYWN